MKYNPPLTKDGEIQHVPIVMRNRDTLIGYLKAYGDLLSNVGEIIDLSNEEIVSKLASRLDSSRFNNYIDDGVDSKKMSEEQIEEFKKDRLDLSRRSIHPENEEVELDIGFFSIDCACGNFITFKTIKDVPQETFQCDICDRTLIHYIHIDDEDVEFDGEQE